MSRPAPTISRMAAGMDFEEIAWLRANSPAWRLLRADNAPLVLSFLHQVFVEENVRSIPAPELASRLDDELYARNERAPHSFPKPAKAYLDDWAAAESGWLRKYYPEGSDEPHFDATPAVEKALQWVRALAERDFVGTESRLNTIFDLLRQIVFGTEPDPATKIEELRRQQRRLDGEIARIEAGEATMLDSSGVRDRYQQFAATARELLADFLQVEENFRRLDRQLREKIAGWQGGKGELLDDVLGSRESIAGSDQGRSFQAFYDFLLSQARQEELAGLLDRVDALSDLSERAPRLRRVGAHRLGAGGASALRLAGRGGAHPGGRRSAVGAAAPLPRRPGLVREPAGHRHPARDRGKRAAAARCPADRSHDRDRRRRAFAFPAVRAPPVRAGPQAPPRQPGHSASWQR